MTAKLTADEVRQIRALAKSGKMSRSQIARTYKITKATVGDIIARRSWRNL
jgi:DNA invertase Pin-like site-specific DNA recombinase